MISNIRLLRLVHRNPLDGIPFPASGRWRTHSENIFMDVSHLRCGGVCFASISGGTEKLSALAEAWAIQRDHLSGGICRRRADSSGNRRLPLGLWEQSPFRSGVNPSGLRAALGSLGVFFRGGQLASGKERRIGVGHCSSD